MYGSSRVRHNGVNVMCVDVDDLLRMSTQPKQRRQGAAMRTWKPKTTDGSRKSSQFQSNVQGSTPFARQLVTEGTVYWHKSYARNELPPLSPADPVVVEAVLREPLPTLAASSVCSSVRSNKNDTTPCRRVEKKLMMRPPTPKPHERSRRRSVIERAKAAGHSKAEAHLDPARARSAKGTGETATDTTTVHTAEYSSHTSADAVVPTAGRIPGSGTGGQSYTAVSSSAALDHMLADMQRYRKASCPRESDHSLVTATPLFLTAARTGSTTRCPDIAQQRRRTMSTKGGYQNASRPFGGDRLPENRVYDYFMSNTIRRAVDIPSKRADNETGGGEWRQPRHRRPPPRRPFREVLQDETRIAQRMNEERRTQRRAEYLNKRLQPTLLENMTLFAQGSLVPGPFRRNVSITATRRPKLR